MSTDDGETRWLTYAELAEARGIDKASAIRLCLRRKWPRQKGNDGTVRVAVPLTAIRQSGDTNNDVSADPSSDVSYASYSVVSALEARVAALEEDVRRERASADRERERADQERARADAVQAEFRQAAERAARAEGAAGELRLQLQDLRGELERARRPAWRRWLGR
jgi:hypothetical protein